MQQRQESVTETRMGGGGGGERGSPETVLGVNSKMRCTSKFCFLGVLALQRMKLSLDVASWTCHRIAGVFNSAPASVLVRTVRLICTFALSASVLPLYTIWCFTIVI